MKQYTQKQLRNLAACGAAIDVTNAHNREAIPEYYTQIGYAKSIYGCGGMLLKGESGQLYVVCSRTSAIYLF